MPLLRDGGITAVLTPSPNEAFHKACSDAGIQVAEEANVQFVKLADARRVKPGAPVAFVGGLWPGVQRPDPSVASATRTLWMDQNCSTIHYIRALHPGLSPVLAYKPDDDAGVKKDVILPFDSLELALVDSWVAGGNYLLSVDPRYREGLTKGTPEALASWKRLGRTAAWLRTNEKLFRQPALPIITMLVEGDTTEEIAHLAFRHSLSPALMSVKNAPAPDAAHRKVLVAVAIEAPDASAGKRILANAEAGSTIVVEGLIDKAWWKNPGLKFVREDPDRNYYSLGKGQVVAYKDAVSDPGSFALDVIDILTQKFRPARLWNCNAGLAMTSFGPEKGSALLHVINYGRTVDLPLLARIQGSFQKAVLLRPEAGSVELKVAPRGTGSEVQIPNLERVATVVFS